LTQQRRGQNACRASITWQAISGRLNLLLLLLLWLVLLRLLRLVVVLHGCALLRRRLLLRWRLLLHRRVLLRWRVLVLVVVHRSTSLLLLDHLEEPHAAHGVRLGLGHGHPRGRRHAAAGAAGAATTAGAAGAAAAAAGAADHTGHQGLTTVPFLPSTSAVLSSLTARQVSLEGAQVEQRREPL
jgi:hypothetical protein